MKREHWSRRSAFIMAAIGSAIGLGNVWRFPYMAYSNGGGAFFIPYLIALITTGIPLMSLEYYLGARYQKGPTEAFGFIRKNTNFIGWFALGTASMITIYYAIIMSWSWNYLFHSIGVNWAGLEKSFFNNNILHISDSIGKIGNIQLPLVIGLFLTWLSIYLIIFKGINVIGKIVKWTVGLPWLLLVILMIRGFTLSGAGEGLSFYLKPDFSELLNPKIWLAAYGQIFFSLSLGFGIMIAYASYLSKDSDINTNSWIVSFANCATSFFAGFAVFSTLGYLAIQTNTPIEGVIDAGPGLAFITFPTAISLLPGGNIIQSVFGILFFFMLLTLGIDSAFSLVEAIVTGIKDSFSFNHKKVAFWVCLGGFLLGLWYATGSGLYWLDIVDNWMNWGLVIVGLMEAVLIGWFFNLKKVLKDINSTSEIKFGLLWIISVKYITPIVLLITIISCIYTEIISPYGGGSYPIWALMAGGWFILISLFYFAILIQHKNNFSRIKNKFSKLALWLFSYLILILIFYLFYNNNLAAIIGILFFIILFGGMIYGFVKMKT